MLSSPSSETIEVVENKRALLEDNINELEKSLRHWQTWEAEYEGLKEEIQGLSGTPDSEALVRVGQGFGGSLVNEKEIRELLGFPHGLRRDGRQVVNLISRRQDYVQHNIKVIQKRIEDLRAQADSWQKTDGGDATETTDDDALPLTEITEQLDDDDNIISATTSKPGDVEPKILEALRRVGLKEQDVKEGEPPQELKQDSNVSLPKGGQVANDIREARSEAQISNSGVNRPQDSASKQQRKSVSFTEDTKPAASDHREETTRSSTDDKLSVLEFAKDLPIGERLVELDDDDNPLGTTTVMPKDESYEDAMLRREMLQYNMEQVGAVVAELDLEDEMSDDTYEDYDDDLDDFDDEDLTSEPEDEDEDSHGRATNQVITEDYRKEMLELEKKLNARMIEVVGPSPDTVHDESEQHGASLAELAPSHHDVAQDAANRPSELGRHRKSVKFAEDIRAVSPPETLPAQQAKGGLISKSRPLSSTIVERGSPKHSSPGTSRPAKASRFKSERQHSAPRANPTGPVGEILAGSLVERLPTKRATVAPGPDGFDPSLHEREVARQYYDTRNKLIQQQGGFTPSSDDIDNPLMEEKDGKIRKVSRFRAARLNASDV
ncbi:MAG: hypothetical protein Q9165_002816 [Trypethelium subeluteriae]